jgi:flagellar basal-body rod protein FlgC
MIKSIFDAIDISSAGLTVQRTKMNLIAENIANVETTRTENGEPYRRKLAVVEAGMPGEDFSYSLYKAQLSLSRSDGEHFPEKTFKRPEKCGNTGVHVEEVSEDPSPFRMVYDPSHPDADKDGYVAMPNVNMVQEMTDLINTSRAFEADITALSSTKDMLRKEIKI